MSDSSEIVVGLDIGTTKIVAMVGRKNEFGKLEILGMGRSESLGVSRGVVANIDKTIESIKTAVAEAEEQSNVEISIVNVGIAGQHIKSLQHRGVRVRKGTEDEISQEDIDSLIEDMNKIATLPGEEIIHILPQEFIVDNEEGILQPIGMAGLRLEADFHIITCQVTAAKNLTKCVVKSGLQVQDMILEPMASSSAVLTNEEMEADVVLIDIGGGTTDIAVFHENTMRHTAVIPFGGNIITEDIKEDCSIIKNQAELLKVKFGSAIVSDSQENEIVSIPGLRGREPREISIKNLSSIIEARLTEIIEHIYYEIKKSGLENKLIAGLVITGGGAQMKHITQLFEYITGMDTRIGFPNEYLAKGNSEEITSPMYATSVGLILEGFKELENKKKTTVHHAVEEPEKMKGKKTSFFESIIKKGKEFFEEDEN